MFEDVILIVRAFLIVKYLQGREFLTNLYEIVAGPVVRTVIYAKDKIVKRQLMLNPYVNNIDFVSHH